MSGGGRRSSRPRLSRRAALLLAIVLLLATALVVPVRQILTQRGEVARLENRLERLEDQRERLSQRVARLRDPEELERIARRCLGMVKPGEIAIVPVPEDGKAPPSRC